MEESRWRLHQQIQEWNENRLDLFALSEPNVNLEFFGVMRFYYEDPAQDYGEKISTKCIRVSSTATVRDVLASLVEKFRPDIRMLTAASYALYEVHPHQAERRLLDWECPLLIQLNWGKDDREGRILMKNINAPEKATSSSKLIRKLSRSNSKSAKQKDRESWENENGNGTTLYNELPESALTRSISNPEMVMRRQRQAKLERKLQQIRTSDGGPESGGTLKIYGGSISPDVPYKTLLLSEDDCAADVVLETLAKYGLDREDPSDYCLVQVIGDPYQMDSVQREYILSDDDCPLQLLIHAPANQSQITFQLRLKPRHIRVNNQVQKSNALLLQGQRGQSNLHTYASLREDQLPYLLEINANGSELPGAQSFTIPLNGLEVGCDRCSPPGVSHLMLRGVGIRSRHCVVRYSDSVVTLMPLDNNAVVTVNGERIYKTIPLRHADVIHLGTSHFLRWLDPIMSAQNQIVAPRQMYIPTSPGKLFASLPVDQLPYLLEIKADGTELPGAQMFTVPLNCLEIGRERCSPPGVSHLLLRGADICPRHCVLRYADTVITLEPLDRNAAITINGKRVFDVIILSHSDIIVLGAAHFLRLLDPSVMVQVQQATAGNLLLAQAKRPNRSLLSLLPATLEYREEAEDRFLSSVLADSSVSLPFRLTPTYIIYMSARQLLVDRHLDQRLRRFISKTANTLHQIIRRQAGNPQSLSLWMANSSELLHFLGSDAEMCTGTVDSRRQIASAVQLAFQSLVDSLATDLNRLMPAFLDTRPDAGEVDDESFRRLRPIGTGPTIEDVVVTLGSIMTFLLRACVNAALTIQLFSQLFHHINQWLFNRLIDQQSLCSREWGRRLVRRLDVVQVWAEQQGLEMAAECHLARVIQAAHLLQAVKASPDDIADICTSCYKLNSLQLRALLQNYIPAHNEPRISIDLINRAVMIAQNTADVTARGEGQEIRLHEDSDLHLPFLLPEDGYSCEFVRGLPNELIEFIQPLCKAGLCRLVYGQKGAEQWTTYFDVSGIDGGGKFQTTLNPQTPTGQNVPRVPEVCQVSFRKINNSIGLSIVAATGEGRAEQRIYVKSVVPKGAAALDGRIQTGDLILEVDGRSLNGLSQEAAASIMSQTGPVVSLKIIRQAAIYDGLAMLLSQPSPTNSSLFTSQKASPVAAKLPAGGHFSKLQPPRSKSTSNLEELDIIVRPAINTADTGGSIPGRYSSANPKKVYGDKSTMQKQQQSRNPSYASTNNVLIRTKSGTFASETQKRGAADRRSGDIGGSVQYPYAPAGTARLNPQSSNPSSSSYNGRNLYNFQQSQNSFRSTGPNASRPFNQNPTFQGSQRNPTYQPPSQLFNTYASQPNLQGVGDPQYQSRQDVDRAAALLAQPPSLNSSQDYQRSNVNPGYSSNLNPGYSTKVNPGYSSNVNPGYSSNVNPGYSGSTPTGLSSQSRQGQPVPARQNPQFEPARFPVLNRPSAAYEVKMNEELLLAGGGHGSTMSGTARPAGGSLKSGVDELNPHGLYGGYKDLKPWSYTQPIALDNQLTTFENRVAVDEPQYAKIRPRSQSLGRNQAPPKFASSSNDPFTRPASTSPWEREERENEKKLVEREKRVLRDKEIASLETRERLRQLNNTELERLSRLKLEADFDRRVEEENNRRAEDDSEMSQALVRIRQEEAARSRNVQTQQQSKGAQSKDVDAARRDWHQLRLDEFDFQILEDKQKDIWRQEREALEKSKNDPPYRSTNTGRGNYPPPPPERKSSYEGYRPKGGSNTSQDSGNNQWGNRNGSSSSSSAVVQPGASMTRKNVSFNNNVPSGAAAPTIQTQAGSSAVQGRQQSGYPYAEKSTNFRNPDFGRSQPPTEMRPSDVMFTIPDDGSRRPYDRQNSSAAPNTPGVVGRQEFYADRRSPNGYSFGGDQQSTRPMPDRMSFRDKMIHFAAEAGEDVPGEKVKNSRAQRELEGDLNGGR